LTATVSAGTLGVSLYAIGTGAGSVFGAIAGGIAGGVLAISLHNVQEPLRLIFDHCLRTDSYNLDDLRRRSSRSGTVLNFVSGQQRSLYIRHHSSLEDEEIINGINKMKALAARALKILPESLQPTGFINFISSFKTEKTETVDPSLLAISNISDGNISGSVSEDGDKLVFTFEFYESPDGEVSFTFVLSNTEDGLSDTISATLKPAANLPIVGAVLRLKLTEHTYWGELPATVELSKIQAGTEIFTGVNNGDERGVPHFSKQVEDGAIFYPVGRVTGFPQPISSNRPLANRPNHSSFIAIKDPGTPNQKVWINATKRGWKITGTSEKDWEYQIRYYSGEPGNEESTEYMQIGTVPNSDIFGSVFDITPFEVELLYENSNEVFETSAF